MNMRKARKPLTEAQKARISAGVRKAVAARKKAAEAKHHKAAPTAAPAAAATVASATKSLQKRSAMMPHGISVLRRHGRGQDVIEGNADEIREAVKFYRDMRKRLKR